MMRRIGGQLAWKCDLALVPYEWNYMKDAFAHQRIQPLLQHGQRVLTPLPGGHAVGLAGGVSQSTDAESVLLQATDRVRKSAQHDATEPSIALSLGRCPSLQTCFDAHHLLNAPSALHFPLLPAYVNKLIRPAQIVDSLSASGQLTGQVSP